jgi:hypothetical protein
LVRPALVSANAGFFRHSTNAHYHTHKISERQSKTGLIPKIFVGILISMKAGRPPKPPEDRRDRDMKIPLSESERETIVEAAEADEAKPVTWARETLLKAAKRKLTRGTRNVE